MTIPLKCTALVKDFEGFRSTAYPDPKSGGAPWTIGFGTTRYPSGRAVAKGDTITTLQATNYLNEDLEVFAKYVDDAVMVPMTEGQRGAMISIVYNVGPGSAKKDGIIRLKSGKPSTLLRKLNAGDYEGAAAEFMKWVSPGSSVEKGLRRRRAAEVELFNS